MKMILYLTVLYGHCKFSEFRILNFYCISIFFKNT